jgi:hypothetical protein
MGTARPMFGRLTASLFFVVFFILFPPLLHSAPQIHGLADTVTQSKPASLNQADRLKAFEDVPRMDLDQVGPCALSASERIEVVTVEFTLLRADELCEHRAKLKPQFGATVI